MKLTRDEWIGLGFVGVALVGGAIVLFLTWPDEVSSLTEDDPTTPEGPDALAIAAGVPLAVYCLARATASEEGGQPRIHQVAVACAALNFARSEFPRLADDDAIVTLVLGTAGVFGRQGSGGRRLSSSRAPGASQLTLAADVLAGLVGDPTGGATQWDSPKGERALLAQGDPLTHATPQQIADRRIDAGYELVVVPGIDPDQLRFWRRA